MDKTYIFKDIINVDKYTRVTKDRFYELIGILDVEVTPEGNYPYVTMFKLKKNHKIVGYQYNGCFILNEIL